MSRKKRIAKFSITLCPHDGVHRLDEARLAQRDA
jgi:hypothetical protein